MISRILLDVGLVMKHGLRGQKRIESFTASRTRNIEVVLYHKRPLTGL